MDHHDNKEEHLSSFGGIYFVTMIIINAFKLSLQTVFIIQFLRLKELTCFERAWYSTHKHSFAWIKWHGSIQHKVSIRQSPRSDLYRFIFYCRWGDTQVEFVIILNAGINQLLHWALILKCIQQASISVQVRKILKSRFNVLFDLKPILYKKPTRCNFGSIIARLLYMFRMLSASIIRSTKNCSSSHWCMSWVRMIYIQ